MLFFGSGVAQLNVTAAQAAQPAIVPLPQHMTVAGPSFTVPVLLPILARDRDEREIATFVAATLASRGVHTTLVARANGPVIRLSEGLHDSRLGVEGYRLDVDSSGVSIGANAGAGLFYGAQTLDQLLPVGNAPVVPGVHIVDWPRFRWRGIHLDVSRHFFGLGVVERYIDVAARYKLNIFHWHLTDDQGWRFPVPRYPRLTTVGGCREGSQVGGEGSTQTDGQRYCGAYTAQQIRDVVAFARRRYVTIVPEIEMPGHSVEALAAYPWLGCGTGPYRVRELWGISSQIFCPTEPTFHFIDAVLAEVARLFPGPYIHIGGDEVPKEAWATSPAVAALRHRERLHTLDAVQGYFTRRVERIARKYGRRIVGWDEILGSSVTSSAVVMAWHGEDAARKAAHHANSVVMCPDPPLYFDAYQGKPDDEPLAIGGLTTTEMVYTYEPIPGGWTGSQSQSMLGVQANLWTEYVPTASHLFYMLLPRALALAEVAWTPRALKNYDGFTRRLAPQLAHFQREGVNFRVPQVTYRLEDASVSFGEQQTEQNAIVLTTDSPAPRISLREIVPNATIHLSRDGSFPSKQSQRYSRPFTLALQPGASRRIGAVAVLPDRRTSAPSYLIVRRNPL